MQDIIINVGDKIGNLTIVSILSKRGKYECICDCGKRCIKHKSGIIKALVLNFKPMCSRQCSTKRYAKQKIYGEIPNEYIRHIIRGAKKRNIEFKVTMEYLNKIFVNQNRKCALSGIDITLDTVSKIKDRVITASIDRIDSSVGYVEGNVQWVHKDINLMKQSYKEEYFIGLCDKVYNEHHKVCT